MSDLSEHEYLEGGRVVVKPVELRIEPTVGRRDWAFLYLNGRCIGEFSKEFVDGIRYRSRSGCDIKEPLDAEEAEA